MKRARFVVLAVLVVMAAIATIAYAQAEKVTTVKEMLEDKAKAEAMKSEATPAAAADQNAAPKVAGPQGFAQGLIPEASSTLTEPLASIQPVAIAHSGYTIGADDMLDISVLQPEKMLITVTVSPDGTITFPYIGTVAIKGLTLEQAQNEIQSRLADGYMKYPVVSIALRQSMSEKFFVYGEVMRPGTYRLEERMTVLKAVSLAGGFTKFGSSSRVKVLRTKDGEAGYNVIKVNLNAAMKGSSKDDVVLKQGDIVVIEEGIF